MIEYGIWSVLLQLSSNVLHALFASIKSLRLCQGKECNAEPTDSALTKVAWSTVTNPPEITMFLQPTEYIHILPAVSYSELCYNCQGFFQNNIWEEEVPSIFKRPQGKAASIHSTDEVNPQRSTNFLHDVAVGTTPVRSSDQVLLKFFPYLSKHQIASKFDRTA